MSLGSKELPLGSLRFLSIADPRHFSIPDPRLYQEIREKGLNSISHESDDDLLEVETIPEEPPATDSSTIVVKNYRPAHMTWSQLPEVGMGDR